MPGTNGVRAAQSIPRGHVPNKTAGKATDCILKLFEDICPTLIRTFTFDNGSAFSSHERLEKELGVQCYFADPYNNGQRGLNENTNGLIRQSFPKTLHYGLISHWNITRVTKAFNERPRLRHGFPTPSAVLGPCAKTAFRIRVRTNCLDLDGGLVLDDTRAASHCAMANSSLKPLRHRIGLALIVLSYSAYLLATGAFVAYSVFAMMLLSINSTPTIVSALPLIAVLVLVFACVWASFLFAVIGCCLNRKAAYMFVVLVPTLAYLYASTNLTGGG
ncbi:MAG: IS30 family transposase [Planctomycetota bacterium]